MLLLHLADVHLDRPFVGLELEDARARRRDLRSTLRRALDLARERGVDAVTIGGDLWEDEHVQPDTVRWVKQQLRDLHVPVVMVAGNHDALSPGGPYDQAELDGDLTLLKAGPSLTLVKIGDTTIWGMSWSKSIALTADVLDAFRVPDDGGRHILLLHGTSPPTFDGASHCPFTAEQVAASGFDLCLAGHLHRGGVRSGLVVYPGSLEPLTWAETGLHAVALVELGEGPPSVELIEMNARRVASISVDCSGADSSAAVEERFLLAVDAAGALSGLCLRASLVGSISPECSVDLVALRSLAIERGVAMVEVEDATLPALDLEALEAGTGVTAVFVKAMRERMARDPDNRVEAAALEMGLRALAGDELA